MKFSLTCEKTDRINKHVDAMDNIRNSLRQIQMSIKDLNPEQIKNPFDRIESLSRTIVSAKVKFGQLESLIEKIKEVK